jgi:alpha-tubulin suppressor-like RCC1 family protein
VCGATDYYSQLGYTLSEGIPSSTEFSTVDLLAGASTSSLSVGYSHSCVMLLTDASIMCWGGGAFGKLGNGGIGNAGVAPATVFNSGSANVQIIAFKTNTYVVISWIFLFLKFLFSYLDPLFFVLFYLCNTSCCLSFNICL